MCMSLFVRVCAGLPLCVCCMCVQHVHPAHIHTCVHTYENCDMHIYVNGCIPKYVLVSKSLHVGPTRVRIHVGCIHRERIMLYVHCHVSLARYIYIYIYISFPQQVYVLVLISRCKLMHMRTNMYVCIFAGFFLWRSNKKSPQLR